MDSYDRRQHRRYEVDPGLAGTIDDGSRITLIDISAAGCLVHAQMPVAPGEEHLLHFRFAAPGKSQTVRATAMHVTPVRSLFTPSHVVGFRVPAEDARELHQSLRTMIARRRAVH